MSIISPIILSAGPLAPGVPGAVVVPSNPMPVALPPVVPQASRRPLQRLAEARRGEGLTRRRVARRLGITVEEVEKQEEPTADMLISDVYRWQKALGVPAVELLRDPDEQLSSPIRLRARLVRVMKTVRTIQDLARQSSVRRLAQTLFDQIVEMMPELKDSEGWPSVGRRRAQNELGQAFFRRLALEPLEDPEE